MKNILSTILVFTLLLSVCITGSVLNTGAEESDPIYTFGDVKYRILEDGTASIAGPSDSSLTHITIPSTVDEYRVSEISRLAFRENRIIESVTVEEGIRSINFQAFYGCSKLSTINLPDSLRFIGLRAFEGTACYYNRENWDGYVLYIDNFLIISTDKTLARPLTEYTIKDGTVSIAKGAFELHNKLETINLPDSLKGIGENAFSLCSKLKKAHLPSGLDYLGWSAFNGCALEEVNIPETITEIDNYTFRGNNFSSLNLHEGITHIGWNAFSNCDNLTEVTIPEKVTQLSDGIFSGCDSLEAINLHDNLSSIGYAAVNRTAFYHNPDNWEEGCLYIGNYLMAGDSSYKGAVKVKEGTRLIAKNAFYNNRGITSVHLPESLEFVDSQTFACCDNLAYVHLPESLTRINNHAFEECPSLESLFIPENVSYVDYAAFLDCMNMKTITISNPETEFGNMAMGYYSVYDGAHDLVIGYATTDELTIRALAGSTAQAYAEENGLNFEEIKLPTQKSDVDGDGTVTIKDATYIQKAVANILPLLREQKLCADTDSDGNISIKDATAIQKSLANLS